MIPLKLGVSGWLWVSWVFFPHSFVSWYWQEWRLDSKTMLTVLTENSGRTPFLATAVGKKNCAPLSLEYMRNFWFYFFSQKLYFSVPKLPLWQRHLKPQDTHLSSQRKLGRENIRWAWNILWCQKVKECSKNNGALSKDMWSKLKALPITKARTKWATNELDCNS